MKEQHFLSTSPDEGRKDWFKVSDLRFLSNGPYTFSLAQGSTLGLTGPSGVGKTQLLRALIEIIPYAGIIQLAGRGSSSYDAPKWRRLVSLVPADSFWWHTTLEEHFSATKNHMLLARWLEDLGFGPDVLGWKTHRLSTGERQRLALLRALIFQPQLLLLDEPTSALDDLHTQCVEKLLQKLQTQTGLAIILVSHDDQQLKRISDQILIVEKNRLVSGSHNSEEER